MEYKDLLEQFKAECKVIDFKYEYPGYVGYEQFGIITELSDQELINKYQVIVNDFVPYIILDSSYKAARDEYRQNEKKHQWRAENKSDAFGYLDQETHSHHSELIGEGFEEALLLKSTLVAALDILTPKQKKRIIKHYIWGLTIEEIAQGEGISFQQVARSMDRGLKRMKKFLIDPVKNGLSH